MNKLLEQGCECVVLEHGTDKVLKIYCTRENALIAIENQRKAHEAGIAPQMFSDKPFEYEYYGTLVGTVKYAIISERVRPAVHSDFDEYSDGRPDDERYWELVDAFECLFPTKYSINDLHIRNLGWMPDGRLVVIDFGALSTS